MSASGSPRENRDNTPSLPRQPAAVEISRVEVPRVDLAKLDRLAVLMLESLRPGLSFALVGTLGAGKTRMTQAIAGALGIDRAEVTSPTFTLVQSHVVGGSAPKVATLHHLDAYRLFDEDEFLDLGAEELFADPTAWTVVEWADRVADAMPADTVWVSIGFEPATDSGPTAASENGDERRRIVFRTDDVVTRGALIKLARALSDGPRTERPFPDSEVRNGPRCGGAESP